MKAFNQAALLIALLLGIGALVRKDPTPSVVRIAASEPVATETNRLGAAAPCPPGALPDNAVCIPVAKQRQSEPEKHSTEREQPDSEKLPSLVQEGILRWPERPIAYDAYRLPVTSEQISVKAFGEPDLSSFAILISAPGGSPVTVPSLEGQVGKAKLMLVDATAGKLITLHDVERSGQASHYLLLYNRLDKVDPNLKPTTPLEPNAVVGALRGVAMQLAAFQLRHENANDLDTTPPSRLITPTFSVPCDLRNILPLK